MKSFGRSFDDSGHDGNRDLPGLGDQNSLGSLSQGVKTLKLNLATLPVEGTAGNGTVVPASGYWIGLNNDSVAGAALVIGTEGDEATLRLRKGTRVKARNPFTKINVFRSALGPSTGTVYLDVAWQESEISYVADSPKGQSDQGTAYTASGTKAGNLISGDKQLIAAGTAGLRLGALNLSELTGLAAFGATAALGAQLELYVGTGTGGAFLMVVDLLPNQSAILPFYDLDVSTGLFVKATTGFLGVGANGVSAGIVQRVIT